MLQKSFCNFKDGTSLILSIVYKWLRSPGTSHRCRNLHNFVFKKNRGILQRLIWLQTDTIWVEKKRGNLKNIYFWYHYVIFKESMFTSLFIWLWHCLKYAPFSNSVSIMHFDTDSKSMFSYRIFLTFSFCRNCKLNLFGFLFLWEFFSIDIDKKKSSNRYPHGCPLANHKDGKLKRLKLMLLWTGRKHLYGTQWTEKRNNKSVEIKCKNYTAGAAVFITGNLLFINNLQINKTKWKKRTKHRSKKPKSVTWISLC